jgi:predicted dehydrogenase
MAQRLRWGIIGTGNIARQFADGVKAAARSETVAVGSRQEASARDFAAARAIPAAYATYDALLADGSVQAVYNSLPNSMHYEWTIKALRAGKHVLCEKPFTTNSAQAQEMFDVAARQGKLLVEAFMYRSHPLTLSVLEAIRSGVIGQVRLIRTSFCYNTSKIDGNVRFSSELAGGVLMDVGCYCTDFSRLFTHQEPTSVHAVAHMHTSGVDDIVVGTMQFPGGALASFSCGMSVHADNTASVCGSEGYIEIPVPWKPPVKQARYTIARSTPPRMDAGKPPPPPRQTIEVDAPTELYGMEADDFAAAVLDGSPPRMSKADTLGNQRVLDEMRRQLGLPF